MIKNWHNESHLRSLVLQALLSAVKEGNALAIIGNDSHLAKEIKEACLFLKGLSPKTKNDTDEITREWSGKLVEMEVFSQKILSASQNIHSEVFGQVNILELAEISSNVVKKKSDLLLKGLIDDKLFEYTKQEFWRIRGKLVKAMELFSEELIFMDIHSPLNDSIYIVQEENSRAVVNKYLDNFIGKSQRLVKDYAHFFSSFKSDIVTNRNSFLDAINGKLFSYVAAYNSYNILPNSEEIQALKKLISKWLKVDDFTKEHITNSDLYNPIFLSINRAKNNAQFFIQQRRKTINVRNFPNPQLQELENRFDAFLKDLNGSEILSTRQENNSISSWLKFQQLLKVQGILASTKNLLQQGNPYFEWKAFLEDCDMQMQHLLSHLINFSKIDWMPMLESWYLSTSLEKLDFREQENLENYILKYTDYNREQFQDFQAVLKTIFWGNPNQSNLIQYIEVDQSLTYLQNQQNTNEPNNTIIVLPQKNKELSPAFSEYVDAQNVIVFAQVASRNYEEGYGLGHGFIAKSLIESELNEKLQSSKALASSLAKYTNNLNFLFTPTKNIITHANCGILHDIVDILKDGNIKQVQIAENSVHQITEYFLNESQSAFFIYDQSLCRFSKESDIIKFSELMEALQVAGYHTIYLDNARFYQESYINDLKKSVVKMVSYA